MIKKNFTLKYIKAYYTGEQLPLDGCMPQSYAMAWCMFATKTFRLFDKADLKEFLFRLAITLHTLQVVENWFSFDKLFRFKLSESYFWFTREDILNHIGFEVGDSYINYVKRDVYLSSIGNGIFNSFFIQALSGEPKGVAVLPLNEEADLMDLARQYTPELSPELLKKAGYFATDMMKFIPGEIFDNPSPALQKKQQELEKRREAIRNMPVFDINKIPGDIILTCLKAMYAEKYAEELMASPALFEKDAKPYIYLAWLYANDLLVYGDWGYLPAEGVYLNIDDYPLEDGGINLNETLSNMELDKIEPLLKGLF